MLQAGCRFAVAVSCMDARQAALIRLFRRFPGLVGFTPGLLVSLPRWPSRCQLYRLKPMCPLCQAVFATGRRYACELASNRPPACRNRLKSYDAITTGTHAHARTEAPEGKNLPQFAGDPRPRAHGSTKSTGRKFTSRFPTPTRARKHRICLIPNLICYDFVAANGSLFLTI